MKHKIILLFIVTLILSSCSDNSDKQDLENQVSILKEEINSLKSSNEIVEESLEVNSEANTTINDLETEQLSPKTYSSEEEYYEQAIQALEMDFYKEVDELGEAPEEFIKCPDCEDGFVFHDECNGMGYTTFKLPSINVPGAFDTKKLPCVACNETGYRKCYTCQGTGSITNEVYTDYIREVETIYDKYYAMAVQLDNTYNADATINTNNDVVIDNRSNTEPSYEDQLKMIESMKRQNELIKRANQDYRDQQQRNHENTIERIKESGAGYTAPNYGH